MDKGASQEQEAPPPSHVHPHSQWRSAGPLRRVHGGRLYISKIKSESSLWSSGAGSWRTFRSKMSPQDGSDWAGALILPTPHLPGECQR